MKSVKNKLWKIVNYKETVHWGHLNFGQDVKVGLLPYCKDVTESENFNQLEPLISLGQS
jgi:hypothetical protein